MHSEKIDAFVGTWLKCCANEYAILEWERTGAHGCFDHLVLTLGPEIKMIASSGPWTVPPIRRRCHVLIDGNWTPITADQWDMLCAPFTPERTKLVNNWWGGFANEDKLSS